MHHFQLTMADGNLIHVHKDFYCYLTIRRDSNEPRLEHENTPDKLSKDIRVVLPDIKCDNAVIHVISEAFPRNT